MKTNQPRLNSINTVLQDHQMHSLVSLAAQSRRLEKLIQAWPPLRGVTFSVGPLKQTTLKLFVSSPAAITRIRQSLPSLIEYLQQTGANITQVQLQIQSQPSLSKQLQKKPKRAVFTASAKQAWLELEKKLDNDSPIRQATEALNRHHKFK